MSKANWAVKLLAALRITGRRKMKDNEKIRVLTTIMSAYQNVKAAQAVIGKALSTFAENDIFPIDDYIAQNYDNSVPKIMNKAKSISDELTKSLATFNKVESMIKEFEKMIKDKENDDS